MTPRRPVDYLNAAGAVPNQIATKAGCGIRVAWPRHEVNALGCLLKIPVLAKDFPTRVGHKASLRLPNSIVANLARFALLPISAEHPKAELWISTGMVSESLLISIHSLVETIWLQPSKEREPIVDVRGVPRQRFLVGCTRSLRRRGLSNLLSLPASTCYRDTP